jgi:hypothetical protein
MNMRNPPFLLNFWSCIDFELVTGSLNPVQIRQSFLFYTPLEHIGQSPTMVWLQRLQNNFEVQNFDNFKKKIAMFASYDE